MMQEATRKKEYDKKINARKFKRFAEYKSLNFSVGASLVIGLLVMCYAYDIATSTFNALATTISLLYIGQALVQYIVLYFLKKQIVARDDIKPSIRKAGIILIAFLGFGNIFAAIAGFTFIKDKKSLEYTTIIYAFINTAAVILVTSLNLFKEYVANNFVVGMMLLSATAAFYLIAMFLISIWEKNDKVDKKLIPVAIILVLTAATGNLFALLAGLVILTKYKNQDQDRSIEWVNIFERLYRNNMALIGMLLVMFLLTISITSSMTFEQSLAIDNNYSEILQPVSLEYPFGTDNFGRCVFTRIIFGARISLIIGVCNDFAANLRRGPWRFCRILRRENG